MRVVGSKSQHVRTGVPALYTRKKDVCTRTITNNQRTIRVIHACSATINPSCNPVFSNELGYFKRLNYVSSRAFKGDYDFSIGVCELLGGRLDMLKIA